METEWVVVSLFHEGHICGEGCAMTHEEEHKLNNVKAGLSPMGLPLINLITGEGM